jgi:hypothetical protein
MSGRLAPVTSRGIALSSFRPVLAGLWRCFGQVTEARRRRIQNVAVPGPERPCCFRQRASVRETGPPQKTAPGFGWVRSPANQFRCRSISGERAWSGGRVGTVWCPARSDPPPRTCTSWCAGSLPTSGWSMSMRTRSGSGLPAAGRGDLPTDHRPAGHLETVVAGRWPTRDAASRE